MHIINNFKIDLLIDINVIKSKTIIINFNNKSVIIKNCNVIASLIITLKKKRVDRIMRITILTIISSFTTMSISIKFRKRFISINKNYNFYFISNVRFKFDNNVFVYIINVNIIFVQIQNAIDKLCILFKNIKIEQLRNYDEKNCYLINIKSCYLTTISVKK